MNWQFCRNVFAMMVALPLLAFCLLVSPLQGAAVGTAFSYQGQLKNSGALVSGNYDFQFRLFDAAAAGSQIGATLTRSSVPVSNGVFNVTLDFGAANYSNQALFLDISVRKTGAATYTALNPRQQLRPTPVALALAPSSPQNWQIPSAEYGLRVYNMSLGDGIRGYSYATMQNYGGLYGYCYSTGSGVSGVSFRGNGIYGSSNHGHAVEGMATSTTKAGVYGHSSSGRGVYGLSGVNTGVYGESASSFWLYGKSGTGTAIFGYSVEGKSVVGSAVSDVGVYGGSSGDDGVEGVTNSAGKSGVYGHSDVGRGVYGGSTSNDGVVGASAGSGRSGVYGVNTSTASTCYGITGRSANGFGIQADGKEVDTTDRLGDLLLAGKYGEITAFGQMALQSDSSIYLDLDDNADGDDATTLLNVRNGKNNAIFRVYENGSTFISGNLYVSGSKSGYVVDIAQNADSAPLTAGDVVMIVGSGQPVVGKIPVIKVRRATSAEAGAVAGVVDQRFSPEPTRTSSAAANTEGELADPERQTAAPVYDSEAIQPGEYLTMVTVGSFMAVKADASFGAIKAGDRLVASPNPGYAMKSGAPQPGTIIGKALDPLANGAGTIPVLVTLQ